MTRAQKPQLENPFQDNGVLAAWILGELCVGGVSTA